VLAKVLAEHYFLGLLGVLKSEAEKANDFKAQI